MNRLMRWRRAYAAAIFGASAMYVVGAAAARGEGVAFTESEKRAILRMSPLPPLPADATNAQADDPGAAALGRMLFFEPRLSANGKISCATCHDPQREWTDGKPVSEGLGTVARNAPTLWNVAWQRWYFWDGRKDTLWSQALAPIEHALEMGGSRLAVAHLLADDAVLRSAYEEVFGALPDLSDGGRFPARGRPHEDDPKQAEHVAWSGMRAEDRQAVNTVFANVGKALAAFERKLVRADAPFDEFVEGLRRGDAEKMRALSPAAQEGLRLFVGRANCRFCHSGPLLSDREFHNIRLPARGEDVQRDAGRHAGIELLTADPFSAVGAYSDARDGEIAAQTRGLVNSAENWGAMRTPSLRNVALTAPYMHQGQFGTLREVLAYYSTLEGAVPLGHHQRAEQILVPLNFTEEEMAALIAFLESLTGRAFDAALLEAPSGVLGAGEVSETPR